MAHSQLNSLAAAPLSSSSSRRQQLLPLLLLLVLVLQRFVAMLGSCLPQLSTLAVCWVQH